MNLKIAELAKLSNVSRSTIYYYLNIGLLHQPNRSGLNRAVYDWSHLSKLKRIIELRTEQNLPLSTIKEIISKEDFSSPKASKQSLQSLINALDDEKKASQAQKSEKKRVEIMDAAIALFSKYGYDKTTLEAIAESLNIAKSTVYLYFKNKEKLFMDCIARLTFVVVPEKAWEEIFREKNALERLKKRGLAFHRAFPSYKGILTMTRAALGGDNKELEGKAKKTLSLMTHPMAKDIRQGIEGGMMREIDENIVSHMILGMGEGLGCCLMMKNDYTVEQGVEIMFDVLAQGLLKKESAGSGRCTGMITDRRGVTSKVEKIRFGNKDRLPVRIGEADLSIEPKKLRDLHFHGQGDTPDVEITNRDGQKQTVVVDGNLILAGETHFGEFSIQLNKISTIQFIDEDN